MMIDDNWVDLRLETARLILRTPIASDAPQLYHLARDKRVSENLLNMPHPYERHDADVWIERCRERYQRGDGITLAIINKFEQRFIGSIGIYANYQHQRAEIGYWLGVDYWGRGFMPEAVECILEYGFRVMRLNRIYATYFSGNEASRRVMEKVGMHYEGMQRQAVLKWGAYKDLGMYSILHREWVERHLAHKPVNELHKD